MNQSAMLRLAAFSSAFIIICFCSGCAGAFRSIDAPGKPATPPDSPPTALPAVPPTPFLIPPHAELKFRDDARVSHDDRYQYVEITRLSVRYATSLAGLQNTRYFTSGEDILNSGKPYNNHEVLDPTKLVPDDAYQIGYSPAGEAFLLQIDYDKLLRRHNITAAFDSMAVTLLTIFSDNEMAAVGKSGNFFKWPSTISQDILAKIFELIPAPQASSPARFGFLKTKDYTIILLSPGIRLKVDHFTFDNPDDASIHYYTLTGTSDISLSRALLPDGTFSWNQLPYSQLDPTVLADNETKGNSGILYLGSTADIQLTTDLVNCPYLALLHTYLKSTNNTDILSGDANYEICLHTPYDLNSKLIYEHSLRPLFNPGFTPPCPIPTYPNYAVYGRRNLITPEIPVIINGAIYYYPFATTAGDLLQQKIIAYRYRLQRDDHKFSHPDPSIVLLPGDQIKF